MPFEHVRLSVDNHAARPWVAVARLSHAAGVHDEACAVERHGRIGLGNDALDTARWLLAKDERHVRVADEAMLRRERLEVCAGDARGIDVFPGRVAWTAMYEGELLVDAAQRQRGKPALGLDSDHFGRPLNC